MEDITKLTAIQEQLGKDMMRILSNMKKTSFKTEQYIDKQSSSLKKLWEEAQKNHQKILELKIQDHAYIVDRYFELQIQRCYQETEKYIRDSRAMLTSSISSQLTSNPGIKNERAKELEVRMNRLSQMLTEADIKLQEDYPPERYEIYYNKIIREWEIIDSINVELNIQGIAATSQEQIDLEIHYEETLTELASRRQNNPHKIQNNAPATSSNNITLPPIKVPLFDGKYEDWPTYHDIFTKVVHRNTTLTNIEKMQYLKTSLRGEASRAIQHFPITDGNYDAAMEILKTRYSNNRLLLSKLVDKILDLPMIHQPSASKIKLLHDTTIECLKAIETNINIDTTQWGPLMIRILTRKWDNETNKLYEQSLQIPHDVQGLPKFLQFLQMRYQSLENMTQSKKMINEKPPNNQLEKCKYCGEAHQLHTCVKFRELSIAARLQAIREKGLCYNCMNHPSNTRCLNPKRCIICNRAHHTLLHREQNLEQSRSHTPNQRTNQQTHNRQRMPATTTAHIGQEKQTVLLATALVKAKNVYGMDEYLRALIDPGSQAAFITEEAATRLALPRQKIRAEVSGFGADDHRVSNYMIEAQIRSRIPSNFILPTSLLVMPKLTKTLPEQELNINQEEWKNQILADPTLHHPGPIDIIIGAKEYGQIILDGLHKSSNGLLGQNTEFGWIISGDVKETRKNNPTIISMISCVDKEEQLVKFWEIEEISTSRQQTEDEIECENHYLQNTVRNKDGTYTVRIPFKVKTNNLGNSKPRAIARLLQLENKLSRDKELEDNYKEFMEEYLNLGHMKAVPTQHQHLGKYYIPHQPVIKTSSTTTKLRVVFDASCKSPHQPSLNETMHIGPRLQQEISDILLRWRCHPIVFTADIEKMYRQIKIHKEDQKYQRILWRFDKTSPIQEYELTTVTYGTTAAPYLAVKTLQQLAHDERLHYPKAAEITGRDFYVDDLLSGADSLEDANQIQDELINMLKSGGFILRKWSTNRPELLQQIPPELREQTALEINGDETIKSLGVHWAPHNDNFRFKVHITDNNKPTKRFVLSEIAKLFDPLGWLAPVIVKAKLIMQKLWLLKLNWEDILPDSIKMEWLNFYNQLKTVEDIIIPRWIQHTKNSTIQLHGFCDASEKAYGAAVYAKTTSHDGQSEITLLIAKSKIAPVKSKPTIPRLELCSAVLLAKLMKKTTAALTIKDVGIYAWTDSMITLSWIKGDPGRWKNFVANRVSEIHKRLPAKYWFHVESVDNPADIISRGIDPSKLQNHTLWWNGPTWLLKENQFTNSTIDITNEEAKQQYQVTHVTIQCMEDISEKFSSFLRMKRVMAYCCRFINRIKRNTNLQGTLTVTEVESATMKIVRNTQQLFFEPEIKNLLNQKQVDPKSKLATLNPFMDNDGILRVGGRLQLSLMPYNTKHPIILPNSSHLTKLVTLDAHLNTLHGGNQSTLAYIRRKFWIINGKKTVKNILNKCVKCIRYKAQQSQQIMGNIPNARVTPAPPFYHTGVDYAGPLQIRASKGRGHKSHKGYIAVFVCFTTKAIHLEAVSDMSTDMFLAAFKRFTSRRGRCAHIYSDNGTTFIGANTALENEIHEILQHSKTQDTMTSIGTKWHFIPAAAPHFGGLWEAAVKSMKYHLKRIIGDATLTYEELTTLLCQIEACLNSRPLCPLSSDPDDHLVLTPGHFLIGRDLVSPPDPIDTDINAELTGRWRLINKIKKEFWKIWSSDYLNQLQQRYKWKKQHNNLKIGDIVIIKEDNISPSKWPLARIKDVHPGHDGLVRVVTLNKSETNTTKRPIHKLIPLPNDHDIDSMEPSTKGTPKNFKKTWRVLIMALLFMTTLSQTKANPYNIYYPAPGMYIEHIGHTKIDRGIFRIQLEFGKSQINNDTDSISKVVNQMEDMCTQAVTLSSNIECRTFTHHLKEKEKQMIWLRKGMAAAAKSRQKRGLFGKILTSLFGVNDEVYQDIEALDKNQHELIRTSTHQTKMMLQSIATFNETEIRINERLNNFRDKLNKGIEAINQMNHWYKSVDINKLDIHILNAYQLAQNYIDELLEHYQKLLDLHYNRGHFYELITPGHIDDLITAASKKLPTNMMILAHPVYKTDVKHTDKNIYVFGYFFITEITEFLLLKTTPIPLKLEEDAYWILDIPNNVLAVDYDNQVYFPLSEEEFKKMYIARKQRLHLFSNCNEKYRKQPKLHNR